ncbi:MAG: type II/IV secretion system protein [Bacteroidetes bacterium]|jgi:type IV pilus assembly protein PilB|nr:type II/IV secretion system protein [Bacteroidota bacterium]
MPLIETEVLNLVPKDLAIHYRIVPYQVVDGRLSLYCDQIQDANLSTELEVLLDKSVSISQIPSAELDRLLSVHYLSTATSSVSSIEVSAKIVANQSEDFVDEVIQNAVSSNSSDIHIEAYEHHARVRYRIDGLMMERYVINKEEYPALVNKIKVRANLDIAEKRLPQDGRINFTISDFSVDIRVSILPSFYGEKIVLRLLRTDNLDYSLDNLGMTEHEKDVFVDAISKPNGIVLISGPTGSGKTTTLYTALKLLNKKTRNILTAENPIEYTISGVNQVQINEEIGFTFAEALRSFLRQDPDVIMIGEIRDAETASMAIRASLTGHLVLSTIHTNSAFGTISRLKDMGIPSFLLTETMNISIAQRLIRKLCNNCKKEIDIDPNYRRKYLVDLSNIHTHYKAVGCNQCMHSGYRGRVAIYDMLPNDMLLKSKIRQETDIQEQESDGLKKRVVSLLSKGITSMDETIPYLIHT